MAKDPVSDGTGDRFVVRPNRSFSWRATKRFYGTMCLIYAAIATPFVTLGAWPVVAFALLGAALLGAALYLNALQGNRCEIIRVGPDAIEVSAGRGDKMRCYRFPRAWARLTLRPGASGHEPSRLVLGARGTALELGGFLVEEERRLLAAELRRALGPSPWSR